MESATIPENSSPVSSAEEREEIFARLVEGHAGAVRRLAESYEADPDLAEDLVQEILLAVWKALPAFRGEASLGTYLFRIAHNRAVRHVARERARRPVATPAGTTAERMAATRPSPEDSALDAESRGRLRSAVRELRESLRQVVVLRLEGLSDREIGEVLGLSSNNVAVRLHRARRELGHLLGNDDDEGSQR